MAFALAQDAFAVSVSIGTTIRKKWVSWALKIALFFGTFQFIMPVIGWFAGDNAKNFISSFGHFIASGLLLLVGSKMIYESSKPSIKENNVMSLSLLLILSVATSTDAFAVGLGLAFLDNIILHSATVIGITTFLLSFLGVFIGNRIGHFFENRFKIVGGLILIGIATKILIEHR